MACVGLSVIFTVVRPFPLEWQASLWVMGVIVHGID
jgi:hypothetical protein